MGKSTHAAGRPSLQASWEAFSQGVHSYSGSCGSVAHSVYDLTTLPTLRQSLEVPQIKILRKPVEHVRKTTWHLGKWNIRSSHMEDHGGKKGSSTNIARKFMSHFLPANSKIIPEGEKSWTKTPKKELNMKIHTDEYLSEEGLSSECLNLWISKKCHTKMKGQIKNVQHRQSYCINKAKINIATEIRTTNTQAVCDRRNANGQQTHTQLTKIKGTEMQWPGLSVGWAWTRVQHSGHTLRWRLRPL